MIYKTQREFRRKQRSWPQHQHFRFQHVERVRRDTWWFLFIPLYSRETVVASTL